MGGESASADGEAAAKYPAELKKLIAEGGYSADQVFNADETGLFWRRLPNRTYAFKNKKAPKGCKAAKERVTILFCSNASGDRLLKPLLINSSLKPRSMRNTNTATLPVHWRCNQNAWMTKSIFREWFDTCFVPEVEAYLKEKGKEFKVLLILDNASCHVEVDHPNVKFVFLPPNTTSLIQPLDQGAIAVFKRHYVKQSFRFVFSELEKEPTLSIVDAIKLLTIKRAVEYIGLSCAAMKRSTLNGCWRAVWPECVATTGRANPQNELDQQIINLAGACGIEGMTEEEVADMLKEQELTAEELISLMNSENDSDEEQSFVDHQHDPTIIDRQAIQEGIALAERLTDFFLDNDPCVERAVTFRNEVDACMARYFEMLNVSSSVPKEVSGKSTKASLEESAEAGPSSEVQPAQSGLQVSIDEDMNSDEEFPSNIHLRASDSDDDDDI